MADPVPQAQPVQAPPAPVVQPAAPAAQPVAAPGPGGALAPAGNAALFGLLDNGDFAVDLGPPPGFIIPASLLGPRRIDLAERGRVLPGLVFDSATFALNDRRRMLRIAGHFEIPHVEASSFTVDVNSEGRASLSASATTTLAALNNPRLTVSIDENKNLAATATVTAANLTSRALQRQLTVTGGGEIRLNAGKLSGTVNATIDYPRLGNGDFALAFSEAGRLSGSGHIELTAPFLAGVRAELAVDEAGGLIGSVDVPAARLVPAIAGLRIESGTVHLAYANGTPSGSLDALVLSYPGLGSASVTASIAHGQIEGQGAFDLAISGFANVAGTWAFREGRLTGSVTINSRDFPAGFPVRSGTITATLGPTGAVSFAGSVQVTLGPAGQGELRAAYNEAGQLSIGATVNLTVPGLQGAVFTVNYVEGRLEGAADVPIDPSLLPGITGAVHVEYREGRWAGETELHYEADSGKLSGTIRVRVAQTEEGALQVTGGGDVTAQIAPRLQGTLHAEILPEGGVNVSGAITVTEPLELFPEFRTDRELFRMSQNIPLWAILVAVIRARAGVRAGVGPGVFRNITVEGSYTIGQEGEPSFSISGELFIPAFAEAYVAFGAGLGLDVVLGSLTGGIEGVATAGIYGAVSVIPVLSYTNGDYMIEGTATLAAGARFKVGLNAWAEIEALWVTVWDRTWQLGEWMWNIGPDLGLQAHMAYNFSHPAPPTLEFNTSDIDTASLVQAAMPEDGPAPSGAREALQNHAEWQGQLRAPGPAAGTVPPGLASQAAAGAPAPPAPPRPPPPPGPPPGTPVTAPPAAAAPGAAAPGAAAPGTPPGARPPTAPGGPTPAAAAAAVGPAPGQPPTPGSAGASAVAAAATPPPTRETPLPPGQAPPTNQPRFPQALSMASLDEQPVPVPRTPEQQQEDVNKASEMVSLVETQVEDTGALESYFPRIKRRFQLSAIALQPEGTGACVMVEINPVARNPVTELLRGDDLARTDTLKLKTEVAFATSPLGGDTVGTLMEARLLGPDHPAGSGPSGQATLMGKLPSQTGSEAANYIRGHLLNDNIGGPGTPMNLFPITQTANRLHERYVESKIKKWVNQDRYWCYYRVAIENEQDNFSTAGPYWVAADIVTSAAVLKVGGAKDTTLSDNRVTVRSQAVVATVAPPTAASAEAAVPPIAPQALPAAPVAPAVPAAPGASPAAPVPPAATVAVTTAATTPEAGVTVHAMNETALFGHTATAFDAARPVQLSTRLRDGTAGLDPDLATATAAAVARAGRMAVRSKVIDLHGVGPALADMLLNVATNPAAFATLTPAQIGLVTNLNDNFKAAILAALATIPGVARP